MTDKAFAPLAILVNPMSGRDVRRLAARASTMTFEAKRDIVARVAAGADSVGVTDIFVTAEPFRIASLALQHMGLKARVHVLEHKLANDASDTERAMRLYVEAGCNTVVSLGGDGTNRAIVRHFPDISLIPLSTGTNNVFPVLAEPTVAGLVAGLDARGLLDDSLKHRVKVLHIKTPTQRDVGLIDAALLRRDHVGNLLPFDAARLDQLVLTRAEPASVGMSPIGGLLHPVSAADDGGLLVELDPAAAHSDLVTTFPAPVSPGLFQQVSVRSTTPLAFDVPVIVRGPGVLALDGDRDHRLDEGQHATVTIRRDGPWVADLDAAMRWAVSAGIMARAWR